MLTTHELRVLYLLRKHGGSARLSEFTHGMQRVKAADRTTALVNCEALELISSAKRSHPPGVRGRGGHLYWLTQAGKEYVKELIERGDISDPNQGACHGSG